MKSLCLLTFFILGIGAAAQTVQNGYVQEYNEKAKKTPLEGVELNVRSAGSTVSGKNGQFALQFLTLKPGEHVSVRRIEKLGYEVFNKEAIEQWNLNPDKPFTVVMCRSDRFKRIRDNYEKVSSESYARQLRKEQAALEKLKTEGKIREEEYNRRLGELRESYERQLDNLDSYIDRFSRIDLSELSATEQEIIDLVQQGRIDEAIARYEEQDYVGQFLRETSQIEEVSVAISRLDSMRTAKKQYRENILAAINRQVETLKLAGGRENNEKAAKILSDVADSDTTDVYWQLRAADFTANLLNDYNHASRYYTTALGNAIRQFGPDHIYTAFVYNLVGNQCNRAAMYDKGIEYHNKALEIYRKQYGEEHPEVATAYANIASGLQDLGRYPEALEYAMKALGIRTKLPAGNQDDIASSYNNIGALYSAMGRHAEALEYFQKKLPLIGEHDRDDLALTYHNIGAAYTDLEHYDEALKYLQKALEISLDIYGENHKSTAGNYNAIADALYLTDKYDEALELYQKSLTILQKLLGAGHPDLAIPMNGIAVVYNDTGRYAEAMEYYRKAEDILIKALGAEHPKVATAYSNTAGVYKKTGQYDKALEYSNKALEIRRRVFGEEHIETAKDYRTTSDLYVAVGDSVSALGCYLRALPVYKAAFGDKDIRIALMDYSVGIIYNTLRDYDKALHYLKESLAIREKLSDTSNEDVITLYNIIAAVCHTKQDYDGAAEYFTKVLAELEKFYGDGDPDGVVAIYHNNIAGEYSMGGRHARAIEHYLKALHIKEKTAGPVSHETEAACERLAVACLAAGDAQGEVSYLLRAGDILEKLPDATPDEVLKLSIYTDGRLRELAAADAAYGAAWQQFRDSCMWVGRIVDGDSPAAAQGMSGTYFILEFGPWKCTGAEDLTDTNNALRGKPKDIVVLKDGTVSAHHFDTNIGMFLTPMRVSAAQREQVMALYRKWKSDGK